MISFSASSSTSLAKSMRSFSTTFSASSSYMCRNNTLPAARAALTMRVTAGFCMAKRPRSGEVGEGSEGKEQSAMHGCGPWPVEEFTIAAMTTAHPEAMPGPARADRIRIVLVGTQHPGNIGSAARALKTMGLGRLVLVAPVRPLGAESFALAAGATDVLDAALTYDTLAEAVADCRLVLGCTARSRKISLQELLPREGAERAVDTAVDAEVALVFGRERTGLENHELQLCHAAIHIPANPDYSSLKIGRASL